MSASPWLFVLLASRVSASPLRSRVTDRIDEGYVVLRVDGSHAAAVEHLPFHHHDPFDRLLIAQALSERFPVITRDRVFKKYGVEVIW